MFDPSSFANPTPLAHADTSRDVLPRGGTSQAYHIKVVIHQQMIPQMKFQLIISWNFRQILKKTFKILNKTQVAAVSIQKIQHFRLQDAVSQK
ncbi:hypothetical protein TNCV_253241 [Trichonephila clavipes]|nr:hypothetical protein TNCV_253241 [Trichonephila clavipes]